MQDLTTQKPESQNQAFQFHTHSNYFTLPKPVWISPPVKAEPFLFSSPGNIHLYQVNGFYMGGGSMKTITVSDEDYKLLMSLSAELQTQPHHGQAAPRYWEPSSEKLLPNVNDEGNVIQVYDPEDCETFSPDEYAEKEGELYKTFLDNYGDPDQGPEYDFDLEHEWVDFLSSNTNAVRIYSADWTRKTEHNPSLFLSDVQGFIESNKHHLGRNPQTYANTIWRMPKMEKLVDVLCRLNPVVVEEETHGSK